MKEIKIPRFLHFLFGEKQSLKHLITGLVFSVLLTLFTMIIGYDDLKALNIFNVIVLIIFMIDIYGGIAFNLTKETKSYYKIHPTLKKLYVIFHPHALLIFILAGLPFLYGLYFYAFLVASFVLIKLFKNSRLQELSSIIFIILGAVILFEVFMNLPIYLIVMAFGLSVKLLYAFLVDLEKVNVWKKYF